MRLACLRTRFFAAWSDQPSNSLRHRDRRTVPGCAASLASKGVCPIGISVAVSRSQLTHSDTAASSLLEPKEPRPPTPMVLPGR
jgi:hypothetical protein